MNILGNVVELFISKEKYDGRISQSELVVDKDGVFIDKFYGKDKIRSVLIASCKSYDIIKKEGIELQYGELGENILVDFDLSLLKVGSQIEIGGVLLEITQKCTICNHLSKIDPKVPKLLKDDRGIFAKVITGGLIKLDQQIKFLKE